MIELIRKNYISLIGFILLLATVVILCYGENLPTINGVALYKIQSTTADISVFVSNANDKDQVIFEYGKTSQYGQEVVLEAEEDSDPTKSNKFRIFRKLRLSGLIPNMLYHYRVTIRHDKMEIHNFDDTFETQEGEGV